MEYSEAIRKADARRFLNNLVKGQRLMYMQFDSLKNIRVLNTPSPIQIHNITELCRLLDSTPSRCDWEGNKCCESDWDEISFWYKGFKFFELVDKVDKNENSRITETNNS